MKNRKSNHHAVQIYAPDVYCLIENCVGVFVDAFALTSVLSPPSNVTVKYNNIER